MKVLVPVLIFASVASAAVAEIPGSAVDQARDQTFMGRLATVQYGVEAGSGWELVSVFNRPFERAPIFDRKGPERWVLRRQSGRGSAFSGDVRWADSANCPQIEGVLWSLTYLTAPSFDIHGITPQRPDYGAPQTMVTVDGPVFSVWGQGRQPSGAPAFVTLSGLGGELDQWGKHAERELSSCWRDDVPTP